MNEPFALITYNDINVLQILSVHSLEIYILRIDIYSYIDFLFTHSA